MVFLVTLTAAEVGRKNLQLWNPKEFFTLTAITFKTDPNYPLT